VSPTRSAASAAIPRPQGIPWRLFHKVASWVALIGALIAATIVTLGLDALIGLTDMHGAKRVILTTLFAIANYLWTCFALYVGTWIFILVAFGFLVAGSAIFGNHTTRARAAVQVATARQPDDKS
jgi:hypothetical protein